MINTCKKMILKIDALLFFLSRYIFKNIIKLSLLFDSNYSQKKKNL